MASRATQSLTTGMKILGGANLPTYTLEFLTPTGKHAKGSYVTIAVPYAEIGRDTNCTVRLGDDSATVSRKHAAIERKDKEVFIVNLSQTNPTLVNGRPVNKKYFLTNGDEIQLSMEGPRLRYNETQTGTAKMGFTNRMNLVMQQSIKPYKMAALSLVFVLVGVLGSGGYFIQKTFAETGKVINTLRGQLELQDQITKEQQQTIASLNQQNDEMLKKISSTQFEFKKQVNDLSAELEESQRRNDSLLATSRGGKTYVDLIIPVKDKVLGIYLNGAKIEANGQILAELDYGSQLMCTGFMIEGGIFVTARHCIDMMNDDQGANFIHHSGGQTTYFFTAQSYDGSINFDFTSLDMIADYSQDVMTSASIDGVNGSIRTAEYFNGTDWAYMQTSYSIGVPFDKDFSKIIPIGTELNILGYSYGMDYRPSGNLEPYFSTAKVTLSGVNDGVIQVTEAGWDGGNSGGPVFAIKDNQLIAIGLVTGARARPFKVLGGDESDDESFVVIKSQIKIVTPLSNF